MSEEKRIPITTANSYYRKFFGRKVYKISLDIGCTCPNRDGTLGTGGCIFCSVGGSGEFASDRDKSVTEQINDAIRLVESKMPNTSKSVELEDSGSNSHNISNNKYIAYLQAFTNTYGNAKMLQEKYLEAVNHPDIVGLSIATRPDCLSDEILNIICTINRTRPVWVELGLQTIHESSAEYIRRGYTLDVYDNAMRKLSERGINVITHVILGLPGESVDMMLKSVDYVGKMSEKYNNITHGIKLQLLHVLKGTDLEKDYLGGLFNTLTLEEYVDIIRQSLLILPRNMVIHRMTGDGDKKLLVAPKWSANKKLVINELSKLYYVL